MKLLRAYLLVIGLWNLERKSMFYRIYRCVMVGYFCLYTFRQMMHLICGLNQNNNEIMKNLGLLITCATVAFKALVCMSSDAGKIIEAIKEREEKMLASQNEGIINIYKYYVKYTTCVHLSFCFVVLMTNISALCAPILEVRFVGSLGKRRLPLTVWMPFNSQKYYYAAFILQCIDSTCGASFIAGTNIFFMSLMIFGICQMKILNFSMRNLESAEDLAKIHNDHLYIIRYLITTKQYLAIHS